MCVCVCVCVCNVYLYVCICVCIQVHICRENDGWMDFKGLAHAVVEAGKHKICKVDRQAGDSGRVDTVWFKSKDTVLAEFLFFFGVSPFLFLSGFQLIG